MMMISNNVRAHISSYEIYINNRNKKMRATRSIHPPSSSQNKRLLDQEEFFELKEVNNNNPPPRLETISSQLALLRKANPQTTRATQCTPTRPGTCRIMRPRSHAMKKDQAVQNDDYGIALIITNGRNRIASAPASALLVRHKKSVSASTGRMRAMQKKVGIHNPNKSAVSLDAKCAKFAKLGKVRLNELVDPNAFAYNSGDAKKTLDNSSNVKHTKHSFSARSNAAKAYSTCIIHAIIRNL